MNHLHEMTDGKIVTILSVAVNRRAARRSRRRHSRWHGRRKHVSLLEPSSQMFFRWLSMSFLRVCERKATINLGRKVIAIKPNVNLGSS